MKEIFYELIREASIGKVIIDGDEWPIGFNTSIVREGSEETYSSDRNISCLMIKNEELFLELLEEYVSLELEKNRRVPSFAFDEMRNHIKYIMTYLFVNATTEDFSNPKKLIERSISFLQDDTFSYLNNGIEVDINGEYSDSKLVVKNMEHGISMEAPNKMFIGLSKDDFMYPISDITYGISDENGEKTCYIYSIMKPKYRRNLSDEEEKYHKKINRLMYKLNDGVREQESDEYREYKSGESDYYPENISDVTPSFVLGLTAFMGLLEKEGISKIKVVPYLPVRYLSREISASERLDEVKREEMYERNNAIQENATNKFIRTFMRVKYHLSDLDLVSFPYEADECLNMNLSGEYGEINNEILNSVFRGVVSTEKEKTL